MAASIDALGPSARDSVRVKIRVHPSGEHYVRVPRTVRKARARATTTRAMGTS